MSIARSKVVAVDASSHATLAALMVAINGATLPGGFIPEKFQEKVEPIYTSLVPQSDLVRLKCNAAPYQEWTSMTAWTVQAVQIDSQASVAAIQTAMDAVVQTQETAGKTLRDQWLGRFNIGGTVEDVLLMLFTDGAPVSGGSVASQSFTQIAELTLTNTNVAALGASLTGSINFAAPLPANARFVAALVSVTTKFQNSGDTATISVQIGDGTTADEYVHVADLHTTGEKFANGAGGVAYQNASGITPNASLTSSVNLSTITAGAAKAKVFYIVDGT